MQVKGRIFYTAEYKVMNYLRLIKAVSYLILIGWTMKDFTGGFHFWNIWIVVMEVYRWIPISFRSWKGEIILILKFHTILCKLSFYSLLEYIHIITISSSSQSDQGHPVL